MKVAVLRFPGANCDQDAFHSLNDDLGIKAEYVWHAENSLEGFDAAFVPGGFSFGDYLRCGAIASRSPIIEDLVKMAKEGKPIIGACNGFQVLCEAGILPGALLQNESQKFICRNVWLKAENRSSLWTQGVDRIISIPIAHGEGRYECDDETLKRLEDNGQVAFRYVGPSGEVEDKFNFNGSKASIAGVLNEKGNVLGLMPHPERATRASLGNDDGQLILKGLMLVNA